ncbi:MAG: ABC transporter substrate-binding protein [Pseudomonadota bacterium]
MDESTEHGFSRREFLAGTSTLGAAALLGLSRTAAAEPPPETTRLRLVRATAVCNAPQYVAEALLRAEGFTEIRYTRDLGRSVVENVASGEGDLGMGFAGTVVSRIDAGDPVVAFAGVHVGCYELFGTSRVNAITDLKGKTVAVWQLGGDHHLFVASMAAYVGLNPHKDIRWIAESPEDAIRHLAEEKIDAYLAFAPEQYELRERRIGHVVVNTTTDKPWSHYFCCLLTGNREFVRKYPVATKRAMRAILKAADICTQEPERVARFLVDKGYAPRYDHALQTIKDLPYDTWRTHDPEDTMRFFALRLHEVGMIKSSPQKIIAQGTDWRFLNELKKELKA